MFRMYAGKALDLWLVENGKAQGFGLSAWGLGGLVDLRAYRI